MSTFSVPQHSRSLRSLSSFGCISNRPGLPAGDTFWDAAQRQLSTHGELHNNVRMTWGKAPLAWCASPQEALSAVLHLNHRYAGRGG